MRRRGSKRSQQPPAIVGREGQAYLAKACGSEICVGISWPITTEVEVAAALKLYSGADQVDAPGDESDLTFAAAVEDYGRAVSLKHGTLKEYRTTVRKLAEWGALKSLIAPSEHRSTTPMLSRDLDQALIAEFLNWVHAQAEKDGNPGRTHNKAREHIRAVLTWLVDDVQRLDAMPRLPAKREQKTAAGLFFLTDDELEALYWATYRLPRPRGWKWSKSIGAYWRGALAVFVTYGVDTQLIFRVDKRAEPMRWRNVYPAGLAPNRTSKQESPHGWLAWSRQKTGHQFCAPLTEIVAAHLQAIRPANCEEDSPIFERAGGGRPCERFQELVALAKIGPKLDTLTGAKVPWTLKDLRKTCATRHDENIPGASSAVLGHAGDGTAQVTHIHYRNQAPLLFRAVTTMELPRAFRSIVDETIRPPSDLLFAK